MMESVASSLLRTRRAGEGVCDWAGVTFCRRKRANTKLATMDFLIVVARFMVGLLEGGAKLREAGESGLANDGDGVVGRKVVAVVGEGDKAEGVDEAVRGIAGDNINLMIEEGAVDEAEVHHVRLPGEVEAVQTGQGAEAVGALEEFVADAGAPLRRDRSDI